MTDQPGVTGADGPAASDTTPETTAQSSAGADPLHVSHPLGAFSKFLKSLPEPRSLTPEEAAEQSKRLAEKCRQNELDARLRAWRKLCEQLGERYEFATIKGYQVYHDGQKVALESVKQYGNEIHRGMPWRPMVLYGPPGTGKDHIMAALMRHAVVGCGMRVAWRNGADLYGEIRDRIGADRPEEQFLRSMVDPDILAISDPVPPSVHGKDDTVTKGQAEWLLRIIDRRYRAHKPVWMTMNVGSQKEAEERLGAASISRLTENGMVLFCNWPDYRAQKKG
jgi:DNA replication protein DnaC